MFVVVVMMYVGCENNNIGHIHSQSIKISHHGPPPHPFVGGVVRATRRDAKNNTMPMFGRIRPREKFFAATPIINESYLFTVRNFQFTS